MSITAILFYWRNDTQSFVTWRSGLATAPDTPTCMVNHGGLFTDGVHPPNQFVPEIVSPMPCSPAIVRHTLLIVYFFKELISFIGSLGKCHTSVFNALVNCVFSDNSLGLRETTLSILNIIERGPPVETKIVRVVFLSTTYE